MTEHAFAQYVRILGRGKKGARSLTQEEAYAAMRMILAGQVEPVQLGAFLMLIRVKEESPEELAGFVAAARDTLALGSHLPEVMVDWSSYAGKRRQLPWFVLSALLLSHYGVSVLMHGTRGSKDDRLYTPDVIEFLGLPLCSDLDEAAKQVEVRNFAFIELENFSPKLKEILNLRSLFGLRSPINTLLRMINPLRAPYLMQGIFHPGYREIHQQAAVLLKQPYMAVFKGEGGETERNPDSACPVLTVHEGELNEETWPAKFPRRHLRDEQMDLTPLPRLWRGEIIDEYATAAVIGTTAIALRLLGRAGSTDNAELLAAEMWEGRNLQTF